MNDPDFVVYVGKCLGYLQGIEKTELYTSSTQREGSITIIIVTMKRHSGQECTHDTITIT